MFAKVNFGLWAAGLFVAAVVLLALRSYFSPESRERRRRDRSHGKVVSRGRGSWIRLAAKTKKSKSDRRGPS